MLLPKNVHYDKKTKSMYVWEYDTQTKRTTKRKCDFENIFFVHSQEPTEWKDIYGNYMRREVLDSKIYAPQELKKYRERGQKTCELSYDSESKFMLWRYGKLEITKELSEQGFHNVFNVGFLDIEISATAEFPDPKKADYPINLITVGNRKFDMTWGLYEYTGEEVKNYACIPDEQHLLEEFFRYIGNRGIDMLIGWNSTGFDFPYIFNRYVKLNPDCIVEQNDYEMTVRIAGLPLGTARYNFRTCEWSVAGLALEDYMKIYDQFRFDPHESMSLDYVCKKNIGKGKMEYDGSIYDFWKDDWNKFVDYNAVDRIILIELDENQKFLELFATFSYSSLIPLHRCDSSIAQIEGYIIKYLHQKGMVLTDTPQGKQEEFEGAYVMANKGLYRNCISFDATSLYPSIIIQWNISPETKIMNPTGDTSHLISTVRENQFYRKDKQGIVPEIVDDIFNLRKKWKDEYNKAKKTTDKAYASYCYNLQLNYKILANSFYGVLGHRSFVFYDMDNASVIPLHGQHIIKHFGNLARDIYDKMTLPQWNKLFPDYPLTEKQFKEAVSSYKKTGLVLMDTDSVTGDTLIETSEGKIRIDKLFERYDKPNLRQVNEIGNVVSSVDDNLKALSVSSKLEPQMNSINYIMKHRVSKRMFKITVNGESVTVTEDHSIMVVRNGILMEAKPNQLQKGDSIITISVPK